MATETEVERMVARLIGDTTQFTTSFEKASKTAEDVANDIGKATDQISAKTIAAGQLIASGIEWAANKLKQFGQQALDGFADAELGELKLKTALEANGRAIESTLNSYKDYASEIQRVTTLEDDYVITLFKAAEQFDTTGAAAKRAVHDAVALAAANDSSADSMIRITSAMAKGDVETAMRFGRMIPQLRGVRDEAQFVAKYALLVKSGFAQAEAETKTFTGTMKQMKVAFGNALEVVGQVVAEAIQPLVRWIKEASDWFQTLTPEVTRNVAQIGMLTAAVGTLTVAWKTFQITTGGFKNLFGAVFSKTALKLTGIAGAVYLVVDAMGGWDQAWTKTKQAATDFWNYVQPTFNEFYILGKSIFTDIWIEARTQFTNIQEFVSGVWKSVGIGAKKGFSTVSSAVKESMIMAGYVFTNFGTIAALMWTNLRLGVVDFTETFEHYFTKVIPTWINWFAENAVGIFTRLFQNVQKMFINMGDNIGEMFAMLPDLISGKISAADWVSIWKPISDGFVTVFTDIPNIATQKQSLLLQQLKKQSRILTDTVAEGYAEYRDRKLAEMKGITKPGDDIAKGVTDPANLAAAALKHVGKAGSDAAKEATEFGSSEHVKRLNEYFDALRGGPEAADEAVKATTTSLGQDTKGAFDASKGQGQGLIKKPIYASLSEEPETATVRTTGKRQSYDDIIANGVRVAEQQARDLERIKSQVDKNMVDNLKYLDQNTKDIKQKDYDTNGPSREWVMDDRNYTDTTRMERIEGLQDQLRQLVVLARKELAKPPIKVVPANL